MDLLINAALLVTKFTYDWYLLIKDFTFSSKNVTKNLLIVVSKIIISIVMVSLLRF